MKLIFGIIQRKSYLLKTNFPVLINQLKFKRITWENETWVDSGGFQIIQHGLAISVKDVLKTYKNMDAYAFFSLDIPSLFAPIDKRNFENFEYLYTKMEWVEKIIPVIHIYPLQDIDEAIDFYKQYSYYFAIGGLIPATKMRVLQLVLPWVHYMRRKVPYLHVLGMSSPFFLQTFNFAESMDTATFRTTATFRKIFWFDGTIRFTGTKSKTSEKYKITEEEKGQLLDFLEKHNFPFDIIENFKLDDWKILELINAYILLYNEWKIKNKYTEYTEKLRKMGLDSLTIELIRNYKSGNEILKQKREK
mgnify:CR=1 FL=1